MYQVILVDTNNRRLIDRTDNPRVAVKAARWLARCGHTVCIRRPGTTRDKVYSRA